MMFSINSHAEKDSVLSMWTLKRILSILAPVAKLMRPTEFKFHPPEDLFLEGPMFITLILEFLKRILSILAAVAKLIRPTEFRFHLPEDLFLEGPTFITLILELSGSSFPLNYCLER